MTDKQMIHNVDVSECKKYEHEIIRCNTSLKNMCLYGGRCTDKKNSDCYYKQLKRAENQIVELNKKVEAKEQECEELKKQVDITQMFLDACNNSCEHYKQTLTEIKPILEYYANSTLGEEQEDGTYRIELSYKYGSSNMYGAPCYYKYNPKPARQALQKISECETR